MDIAKAVKGAEKLLETSAGRVLVRAGEDAAEETLLLGRRLIGDTFHAAESGSGVESSNASSAYTRFMHAGAEDFAHQPVSLGHEDPHQWWAQIQELQAASGFVDKTSHLRPIFSQGRLDEDSIWRPIRKITELPFASRREINDFVHDVPLTNLMDRHLVREFVDQVAPAVGHFRANTVAIARAEDEEKFALGLLKPINSFAKEHNFPQMGLEVYDPVKLERMRSAMMYYTYSKGYIGVKRPDLLRMPNSETADTLISGLYHESTHGKQAYDEFRAAAHFSETPRIAELTDVQKSNLQTALKEMGLHPNDSYLERSIKAWSTDLLPFTARDEARAAILRSSRAQNAGLGQDFAEAGDRVEATSKILKQLGANGETDSLIADLQSKDVQHGIWGYDQLVPKNVQAIISGEAHDPTTVRAVLNTELQSVIIRQNDFRQGLYVNYKTPFHEVEAWLTESRANAFARQLYQRTEGFGPH